MRRWKVWLALFVILFVFALSIPVLIAVFVLRLKRQRMLDDKHTIQQYGVLYKHYRPEVAWWYQSYQMSRRLLVLGVFYPLAAVRVSTSVSSMSIWALCVVFVIVHLTVRAHKHARDLWFEAISLLGLVVIATFFSSGIGSSFHVISAGTVLGIVVVILLTPVAVKYWHAAVSVFCKAQNKRHHHSSFLERGITGPLIVVVYF